MLIGLCSCLCLKLLLRTQFFLENLFQSADVLFGKRFKVIDFLQSIIVRQVLLEIIFHPAAIGTDRGYVDSGTVFYKGISYINGKFLSSNTSIQVLDKVTKFLSDAFKRT